MKLIVYLLLTFWGISTWAQTSFEDVTAASSAATFKLTGDVALMSHYVEHGLSQTDKDPSLQGSFWFNFGPQFRMGLWGSNVKFSGEDDHFNLRGNADIKINFSKESVAVISYSHSQYYSSGDRNGSILGLHMKFGTYKVVYDSFSNWEGTGDSSARFGLGKEFDVFGDWKWNNEVGYNMPTANDVNSYFDFRTGIGTKAGVIFVEGAVSATSAPNQFHHGVGDIFLILSASVSI